MSVVTDTYSYVSNGTGSNPKLTTIGTSPGGAVRTFAYDAIGDEARASGAAAEEERIFDDAGDSPAGSNAPRTRARPSDTTAEDSCESPSKTSPSATPSRPSRRIRARGCSCTGSRPTASRRPPTPRTTLYFAGRPVALLSSSPGPSKLTWLTTDHLGTPVLSTLASPGQATTFVGGRTLRPRFRHSERSIGWRLPAVSGAVGGRGL